MTTIKLSIGVPAYGSRIQAQAAEMWLTMGSALADSRERFELRNISIVDVCGIDVARNRLLEEAIDNDADWLLMIDADTWHPDGFDLLSMISKADRAGAAVVAAPVPKRDPKDPHLMVYQYINGDRVSLSYEQLKDGEFVPIDCAATALMAINVNFAKKLPKPWFWFRYIDGTNRFRSEDINFCDNVKLHGGSLLAYTSFIAKHLHRPSF